MLNIVLPQNFNSPYKSTSIIDFWQRWHITLTNFLTNFIYYPLLKSLKKINFFNSMIATVFVFLIAGIWHGPSWNFVLFGLFHGFGLVTNHIYKKYFNYNFTIFLSWFLTFNYVNISFIFFRTANFDDAILIIKKMFDLHFFVTDTKFIDDFSLSFLNNFNLAICFLLSLFICFFFKNSSQLLDSSLKIK
jgi:D-alanyl-lipoteichoic acid acyltransferase DltB (MBOAT superfamily)